jgi:hypothetical protein
MADLMCFFEKNDLCPLGVNVFFKKGISSFYKFYHKKFCTK